MNQWPTLKDVDESILSQAFKNEWMSRYKDKYKGKLNKFWDMTMNNIYQMDDFFGVTEYAITGTVMTEGEVGNSTLYLFNFFEMDHKDKIKCFIDLFNIAGADIRSEKDKNNIITDDIECIKSYIDNEQIYHMYLIANHKSLYRLSSNKKIFEKILPDISKPPKYVDAFYGMDEAIFVRIETKQQIISIYDMYEESYYTHLTYFNLSELTKMFRNNTAFIIDENQKTKIDQNIEFKTVQMNNENYLEALTRYEKYHIVFCKKEHVSKIFNIFNTMRMEAGNTKSFDTYTNISMKNVRKAIGQSSKVKKKNWEIVV